MRQSLRFFSVVVLCLLTNHQLEAATSNSKRRGQAERKGTVEDLGAERTAPPGAPNFPNLFETRPSLTTVSGEMHTENTLELGLNLSPNSKVSYVQFFNTNIWSPTDKKSIFGLPGFLWQDAYFRLRLTHLWQSEDQASSFSMQTRVYVPTMSGTDATPSKLNQGMLTTLRQYFTVAHNLNSYFMADFSYTPTFFIFRKSGFQRKRSRVANPWFEHLLELNLNFHPCTSVSLVLPVIFQMRKFRNDSDRAWNNDRWSYNLWTWPEIDWRISEQQTIGIAYQTDNFLKRDASGVRGKSAYKLGVAQLIWNISF